VLFRSYGLAAHVQLYPPGEILTYTDSVAASPLVESVFAQVRDQGRLFPFGRRLAINFPHVSVLVKNLPIEDEDRTGRLRDHLATIGEGCEAGMLALIHTADIEARNRQLQETADAVRQAIDSLRDQYAIQQTHTESILLRLQGHVAGQLIVAGLTESQEQQLLDMLGQAVNQALALFQNGVDFDAELGRLLAGMAAFDNAQAADPAAAPEKELAGRPDEPDNEIWT
jgi:hypothetical protein